MHGSCHQLCARLGDADENVRFIIIDQLELRVSRMDCKILPSLQTRSPSILVAHRQLIYVSSMRSVERRVLQAGGGLA